MCRRELFSRCTGNTAGPAGGVHYVQAVRLDLVVLGVLPYFDPLISERRALFRSEEPSHP